MAGNGDILDFDTTNAPQDELAVQTHHITAEELFKIPAIKNLLEEAGITRDSRANLTIVAKDPACAEFLQGLGLEQQQRFVDAGLSANYQGKKGTLPFDSFSITTMLCYDWLNIEQFLSRYD
jgi:hypothetical protein